MRHIRLAVALVFAFGLLVEIVHAEDPAADISAEQLKFFEAKVRPLLANRCFKCHGADKQKGELRLDSRAGLLAGGESGAVIVPGKSAASLLVEAINYESFEMPPNGQLPEEEIATLTAWIDMGAPWPGGDRVKHGVVEKTEKITDEDRAWWAFQPVRDPAVPQVAGSDWCQNDIDRFVLRRLKEQGLAPSSPAAKTALVRRLYFDLIGLPPTPEQVQSFLNDDSPSAYERLVDQLLDSPRYGEKWARHWLDLVRFAESDGYKADGFRPEAWRYRDYVIKAFNDDKPYTQFVMEQLAGDEVAPHDRDALVATQYLRHGMYEFNQRDVRAQWGHILNEITDVTGDVFLGMGMSCARCHDHKFDPILQKDYFRLQAFFTPLMLREDLQVGTLEELAQQRRKQREWEEKAGELRRQLDEIEWPLLVKSGGGEGFAKFTDDLKAMMLKPAYDRLPLEAQLSDLALRQIQLDRKKLEGKLNGERKQQWQRLKEELAQYEKYKPASLPTWKFCVSDVGRQAPPTYIPDKQRLGVIEPGFLSVLDESPAQISPAHEALNSTGRRTALARWIASDDNPLSTRVIVNRVWAYYFGRGIVETTSDFGNLGEKPTHPELLDWLTSRFVEGGWRLKPLHRMIVTSATYRQNAMREDAEATRKDPQNQWLWRQNIRRLSAEQIRDAMLAVTGELDLRQFGPSVRATSPRRTVYTKIIRNEQDPLLDVFDAPDGVASVSERNKTTTSMQALFLINSDWSLQQARQLAARLKKENLGSDQQRIERAWWLMYGRQASAEEAEFAMAFLRQAKQGEGSQTQSLSNEKQNIGKLADHLGQAALFKPDMTPSKLEVPFGDSLPAGDFTIEAFIQINSLYKDATVRTIAAHWNSNNSQPGWSLGVTSEKSKYRPRNVILQLIGKTKSGPTKYEVIASDIHVELNQPYYIAASVKIADTGKTGVTFYVKALDGDAKLHTSQAEHEVIGNYRPNIPFTIGGRHTQTRHAWDGLIDEVRLSSRALQGNELLINMKGNAAGDATVGLWRFEEKGFYADTSIHKNNLAAATDSPVADADTTALIDFCHVLLNSNEFLYVD